MPTPPKPVSVLRMEGRSHRTKAELEAREKAEAALLTGKPMQEWPATKKNPDAHKQFLRLRKLLGAIGKNDALNEAVINRYCVITAEAADIERDRARIMNRQATLDEWLKNGEMDSEDHYTQSGDLLAEKDRVDKSLSVKRKMLLDMEKENIMTIAAALRNVPKQPEKKLDAPGGMDELLARRMRKSG